MNKKKVRQLAAVMFTDIVGYTALMQGDEKIAIKVRTRHREVFQQQHGLHQGEIKKAINKTIAVLPFVSMSASKENEYFSDGITEEIINALAKIKNLQVTSRTSSFFFKGKNVPIKQTGCELNVTAILEGSVRLSGDKIRITAQLIRAEEDIHFWPGTRDRRFMATTGFMPFGEAWAKSAQLTHKAHLLNDQLPGVCYQMANA
ncbi:MAG: hypothetical protein ABI760_16665 [Ferruginibacter sp.]